MSWQRFEKPDFAYALSVPEGWEERPTNLRNSPWETARFAEPADRRHMLIVFRQPVSLGQTSMGVAERVRTSLEGNGFADFAITEAAVAGRPGARIDCVRRDAGREWFVRQYLVVRDDAGFCLGFGSSILDEDEPLFTGIADSFELLDAPL